MHKLTETALEIEIRFLQKKLNQLNYDENGNPIGVDADEYRAINEKLDSLESEITQIK